MDTSKSKRGDVRKRFPEKAGSSGDKQKVDDSKRVRVDKQQLTRCQKCCSYCTAATICVIFTVCFSAFFAITVSPSKIRPSTYRLPPPPPLIGALTVDSRTLTFGRRIFNGKLLGPEAFEPCAGALYTGTADGRIWRIESDTEARSIIQIGVPEFCDRGIFPLSLASNRRPHPSCGRPSGLACLDNRSLVVADMLQGILRIDNIAGGAAGGDGSSGAPTITKLVPKGTSVNDVAVTGVNAIAVLPDGRVVASDCFPGRDPLDMFESALEANPIGRVIVYDPKTQNTSVLAGGFRFPNGVVVSHDKSYLLIAELMMARIWKFHLSGEHAGEREIFADNLPGFPDNMSPSADGGYWTALGNVRHAGNWFNLMDMLAPRPWARKLIATMVPPHMVTGGREYGLVVKLDASGRVVDSLHDRDGALLHATSGAYEHAGALWLASYEASYAVSLPLPLPSRSAHLAS